MVVFDEEAFSQGYMRFVRQAGDNMGWGGLLELWLCIYYQYPEKESRQNLPLEKIKGFLLSLNNDPIPPKFLQLFKLNAAELGYALDYIYNPDGYRLW